MCVRTHMYVHVCVHVCVHAYVQVLCGYTRGGQTTTVTVLWESTLLFF